MRNSYDVHTHYLHEFVRQANLEPAFAKVGKSLDELVGIITEPEYVDHSMRHITMCDYLFLFDDCYCVPGELKGNKKQRKKAVSQLNSGKEFAETVLQQRVDSGLFIVYNRGEYIVQGVDLNYLL